jgi:hypothetical protein
VEGNNKEISLVLQVGGWLRVNIPNREKHTVKEASMKIHYQLVLGEEGIPRGSQMKHCRKTQTTVRLTPLLNPRKSKRIGTWNIRTTHQTGRTAQVVKEMQNSQD